MENKSNDKKITPVPSPSNSDRYSWSSIGLAFSTFAVIVLIVVFSFSFYKVSILGKQMQLNESALQQRVADIQMNMDGMHQELQQSNETMKQTINEIHQTQNSDKNSWRVLEAQYYVKLAAANLEYQNNLSLAVQLLQTADKELQALNDPKFDGLRKAIADDLASLQTVQQVDYTGIYLRLSALDGQVNNLPFMISHTESVVPVDQTALDTSWWKHGLNETWKALQKIVVVRYHSAGVPPLVTPDQQDFIRQNLHAMFEQAMWAVLNKKPEVYRASLQQTAQWIQQYFVADASVTQAELSGVNQLLQIDIKPSIPKITASLQAFHDYLEKSTA